ncbi:MAG: hypothetical protein IPI35_34930 [Deltaproteobacteria bacterium]|nr:hypothetical protein [Deltaproteobacteria bacterium]
MSNQHPTLRQVDFIGFSVRAERLWGGAALDSDLLNTLYPVGYPALLGLGQRLCGDVLWAGKGLAVLAGAGLVGVTARWLGVGAALWALATPMALEFGAVEGADMPAAALSLAAWPPPPGARPSPGRFWRAAILAATPPWRRLLRALWLTPGRAPAPPLTLTLAPPTGAWPWQGAPLPDQSMNMAIGAGGPGQAPSAVEALQRAALGALEPWTAKLGALGLLVGLWRRDRRAWALSLWGPLSRRRALVGVLNPPRPAREPLRRLGPLLRAARPALWLAAAGSSPGAPLASPRRAPKRPSSPAGGLVRGS